MKDSKIITPIDKERFVILGLDPRSPAADFDRTPILMPKSLTLIKARSQENLNRRGSYETDIYNPKISYQEIGTSLNIPKIRLLSDTTLENLKSPLDTKEHDGPLNTLQYDSDLSILKNEKEITVIKSPKCTNEESLILGKQIAAIDNEEDKDETEKQDDCENIESITIEDDGKIKLWHDSLSLEESISGKEDWKELSREKTSRENVIIMFDKCITISSSLKPIKTKGDFRKKKDVKGKKRNAKVDVKLNEENFFIPESKLRIEVYEVIYVTIMIYVHEQKFIFANINNFFFFRIEHHLAIDLIMAKCKKNRNNY